MKITQIESIPVDVPRMSRTRITSSTATLPSAKFTLVVVHTDDGVEGYGEASPEWQWTGEDDRTCDHMIRQHLAPPLIGRDPLRIQAAFTLMESLISFNTHAKSAIEMALWDIAGKVAGLPLAELWGGRVREAVKVKFVVSGPPDRAASLAQELVASGFRFIKIKTGTDPDQDIARVHAVRAALDPTIPIGVDSNMGWSLAQALRVLPVLEEVGVAFIEQPFNRYPREALLEFRRRSKIPIVAHESLFNLNDALELMTSRAADIWAITPGTHGGYLPTRDILGLARAGQFPCLLGSTLELGINSALMGHVALSDPAFDGTVPSDLIGPLYHEQDVINEKFELIDGEMHIPTGPGLGVTLNWDAIAKYRTDGK
jgi:L-alanine-DL-glutamate epimerase-like enolase superfamily enzyme